MSEDTFGRYLRITTFGESHGPGVGVVLDGLPPGLHLDMDRVRAELSRRSPGRDLTSQRREPDEPEILSGLLDGVTTGTALTMVVRNKDARARDYARLARVYRPGHGTFTWLARFGLFDHRGGGRASGRETLARVMAGAVARQLIESRIGRGVRIRAFVHQVGTVAMPAMSETELLDLLDATHPDYPGPVPCPHEESARAMEREIRAVSKDRDSVGAVVRCLVTGLPAGLGEPVFGKVTGRLAHGVMSIPATRGIEFGLGFAAASLRGSQHNDRFTLDSDGRVVPASNRAGGVLGGITTSLPLDFRVAFKPTPTISLPQETVTLDGRPTTLEAAGRHDPCLAIRAPVVVEAMTCLVLADLILARDASPPAVGAKPR